MDNEEKLWVEELERTIIDCYEKLRDGEDWEAMEDLRMTKEAIEENKKGLEG